MLRYPGVANLARRTSRGGGAPTTTTQTVSVADSADPVITGGDAFSYTVQYTNTGSATATSVSVAITVDASLAITGQTGTGWSFSVSGQVITCTRASAAVGAAPAITVNVTTGGSALTATTTAQATASNAATANGSQTTTVQFVTKDATAAKYYPATSTEWSNFIARKGLTMAVPDSLYLMQYASGNATDAIGALTLTKAGTVTYQQAVAGHSRLGCSIAVSGANGFSVAAGTGPNPSTTSVLWLLVANVTASATANRSIIAGGGAANATELTAYTGGTAPAHTTVKCTANTTNGTVDPTAQGVIPYTLQYDRTNSVAAMTTPSERITATFNSGVTDGTKGFGGGISSCAGMTMTYGVMWSGAHAEVTDAQIKALEQALGWTITR